MKILLVEPNYKNKYPPLGLMKLSTYHKQLGDQVVFVKGTNEEIASQLWDRIYISSLFTFYYSITVNTLRYYLNSVNDKSDIYIGGPMATIMKNSISKEDLIPEKNIVEGLLDKPGIITNDSVIIDELIPDYSIIDREQNQLLAYRYPVDDSYYLHITHGCIRKCVFCAVPIIEPTYNDCTTFTHKIHDIDEKYGFKRNLKVMDNNILASNRLDYIVDELVKMGFGKGNKSYSNGKRKLTRYVDFNQGLDARLLYADPSIMETINKLEIKPMRVAFDHANAEFVKMYTQVMRQAAELRIRVLSNYVLFNLDDNPKDLYDRLKINVELNKEFSDKGYRTSIWSFPMKYSPIFGEHSYDRKYIGKNWNKKMLRGIQCIMIPTHGVVGPKMEYFFHAFGSSHEEFERILIMPEKYIIQREKNTSMGNIRLWNILYDELSKEDKTLLVDFLCKNNKRLMKKKLDNGNVPKSIQTILKLYVS